MSLIGGVLDLASSIVSATTHGGDSSPKMETKDGGKGAELDLGPLQVSVDGKDLSVKLDGKEVAKVDVSKLEGKSGDQESCSPALDLHSADTFEAPKPKPPVANLFDTDSGGGSKPGGAGDGRA